VYWFLQPGWWLLHTSPQLHPDPWTWTSQGLPDCINPLGPEHCNQRKEVLFQGQDNYIGLYRFLDDFIVLYLTFGLGHTKGDDRGKNWIVIDVDLIVLLYHHTPPCDHNHASCDARTWVD
jgi:hypothetical protein